MGFQVLLALKKGFPGQGNCRVWNASLYWDRQKGEPITWRKWSSNVREWMNIWVFPKIGVPINHPFWGTPIFGTPILLHWLPFPFPISHFLPPFTHQLCRTRQLLVFLSWFSGISGKMEEQKKRGEGKCDGGEIFPIFGWSFFLWLLGLRWCEVILGNQQRHVATERFFLASRKRNARSIFCETRHSTNFIISSFYLFFCLASHSFFQNLAMFNHVFLTDSL